MPQKKGGRVPTGSAIGATMFRRMQKDKRTKRSDSGLGFHVADLELSSNPLQSVTQASSMEEFMAVAAMSERDFTAERGQLTFVEDVRGSTGGGGAAPPPGARGGSFGPVTTPRLLETPSGTIRNLQIPRRPRWDGKSPEELARAEKDAFLEWRREVARAELAHGGGLSGVEDGVEVATVTPFEKNIDVWRQLWRVVERCDVLVQIVDARNPLLYRCPDLEDYVREVNPLKRCLLLINKADYLTHAQRAVWAKHLSALGVRYIFFSARREQLALEELDRQQQGILPEFSNVVETIPLPSDFARDVPSLEARSRGAGARSARAAAVATMWEVLADDEEEEEEEEGKQEKMRGEGGSKKAVNAKIEDVDVSKISASPIVAVAPPLTKTEHAATPVGMTATTSSSSDVVVRVAFDDPARILTRDELLDFLVEEYKDLPRGVLGSSVEVARRNRADKTARDRVAARAARREELTRRRELNERLISAGLGAHVRFGDEADIAGGAIDRGGESLDEEEEEEVPPLQIGMVGYPNVGKSSTINALTGATAMRHGSQRVAVASTPGKTKHFQTITLNDDITLCDCPGLVFPSFVHSREEMVVNGILPIDQLRDHVSPIRLLCQRIPRETLEATYGFRLEGAGMAPGTPLRRQPTPTELLDTYCRMRGFAAAVHSGWDHPRGSRILLKDFCEGKLVYCHPPPGGSWSAHLAGAAILPTAAAPRAIENVLLASVVQKKKATQAERVVINEPVVIQSAAISSTLVAAAAAAAAATIATDDEETDDESLLSQVNEAEDSTSELDEADLLAFSRVVLIPRGEEREEEDDDDDESDEEEEEEEEEENTLGRGVRGGDASTTTASIMIAPPRVSQRAPREKGLTGRSGRGPGGKKGSRDPDPYGTARAADAANRKEFVAEVLKVAEGAVMTGGEAGTADTIVGAGAAGATVSIKAPAWVAPIVETVPTPGTKKVRQIGGATVQDPVRDGLRGIPSRLSGGVAPVAFPAKLLRQALDLQARREEEDN